MLPKGHSARDGGAQNPCMAPRVLMLEGDPSMRGDCDTGRRRRGVPAGLAALAALVLLSVAACAPTAHDTGPPASASVLPSGEPTAQATSSTAPASLPASPTVTPTSPGSPTAPSPAGTSTPGTKLLQVYFFDVDRLVPVQREVPATVAVARAAMTALLSGPTTAEAGGAPPLGSEIPPGTALLGVSVGGGTAVVDLSGEFQSGGGSASMFGRLAQVVYTLTQFPTVTGVTFRLDGQPVTTFSSEGIVLSGPSVRADFRDYLPAIFVDRPAWGATLPNPARVSGLANVFEAQFVAEVATADGTVLARRSVLASCGTGCWGTFDVTIAYGIDHAQPGRITVYDLSARDGTRENVRSYPVTLRPTA